MHPQSLAIVSQLLRRLFLRSLVIYHINELIRQTNAELDKLNVWFSVNRLSLNIAKTNYMIFGNRTLETSLFIKINKVTIKRVEATKFLCVLIDDKLTWKHHISLLKKGCKINLWCSEVRPHI